MQPIEVRGTDPLTLAVAAAIHVNGPMLFKSMAMPTITEFHMIFHAGVDDENRPAWFLADICDACRKMIGIECQCAESDPVMATADSWC